MPRLPRVMSSASIFVFRSIARPARSSASRSSPIRMPSTCFGLRLVRRAGGDAVERVDRVPRVDEDGHARPSGPPQPPPKPIDEGRRDQAEAVVGDAARRRRRAARRAPSLRTRRAAVAGTGHSVIAIDPDDLLLGRMDAASQDSRLHRRGKCGRAQDRRRATRDRAAPPSMRAPGSSRPARPATRTRPPSAAALLAALPAPPGTTIVVS